MKRFVVVMAGFALASNTPLPAQTTRSDDPVRVKPIGYSLSLGPSLFSGSEGNYPGLQAQAGIAYRPATSVFGARADLLAHRFDTRALYPCLLQHAGACFQTSQRTVIGLAVGLTFHPPRHDVSSGVPVPYLIGGMGVYGSRRDVRRQADCTPEGPCVSDAQQATIRDTDFGVHVGAGVTFLVSGLDMFAELRLHEPVWKTGPERSLRDFRLVPLSIGIRF